MHLPRRLIELGVGQQTHQHDGVDHRVAGGEPDTTEGDRRRCGPLINDHLANRAEHGRCGGHHGGELHPSIRRRCGDQPCGVAGLGRRCGLGADVSVERDRLAPKNDLRRSDDRRIGGDGDIDLDCGRGRRLHRRRRRPADVAGLAAAAREQDGKSCHAQEDRYHSPAPSHRRTVVRRCEVRSGVELAFHGPASPAGGDGGTPPLPAVDVDTTCDAGLSSFRIIRSITHGRFAAIQPTKRGIECCPMRN